MRTALAFVALLCASLCYGQAIDPDPPPPVEKPKPPDPVKPPLDAPVINLCGCQVGEPCTCGSSCHCQSATWSEVDGVTAKQIALFKNGKQIGSYRFDTGVFLPLSGSTWGKACRSPIPLPGRGSVAPVQSVPQFQPQSFFPQIRSGGRSGSY